MAIADLLWACPACGGEAAIARGTRAACAACGAAYRRGPGATIVQRLADGRETVLDAAAWLERLDARREALGPLPPPARVLRATGRPPRPVRRGRELVGWAERFGPRRPGRLSLEPHRLVFTGDDGSTDAYPLDEITAVQPSSSTLLVKLRGRPVAGFRLLEGSIYDWERRLQEAVRRRYRESGRGEIAEFLPRIVCR